MVESAEESKGKETLEQVFFNFTSSQPEMDGRQFAKVFKDTKLLGGGLTNTEVDLIFAKVKEKAARKINFA